MSIGEFLVILLVEDDPAHVKTARRNLADFRVANRTVHVEDGTSIATAASRLR
jgi:hypothetical protein